MFNIPFFPDQASNFAARVDSLYFFLVAVTGFFAVLVVSLVVIFAVKFRRKRPVDVGTPIHGALALELTWTFIPLVIALFMFVLGRQRLLRDGAAAVERDGDLCGRQAVDVEVPARHRAARDQRAAPPAGPADQGHHRRPKT